jgi:hypothetical protein
VAPLALNQILVSGFGNSPVVTRKKPRPFQCISVDRTFSEGTTGRTLTIAATTVGGSANLTVANCLSACQTAGYNLAGAEYSGE